MNPYITIGDYFYFDDPIDSVGFRTKRSLSLSIHERQAK